MKWDPSFSYSRKWLPSLKRYRSWSARRGTPDRLGLSYLLPRRLGFLPPGLPPASFLCPPKTVHFPEDADHLGHLGEGLEPVPRLPEPVRPLLTGSGHDLGIGLQVHG